MKTKLIPMIIGAFVISKQEKYLQQIRGIRRIRDLYAENKKEQKDKILNPQFFRSLVEDLKNPENKATYRGREIFFFFKQKYEKLFSPSCGWNESIADSLLDAWEFEKFLFLESIGATFTA